MRDNKRKIKMTLKFIKMSALMAVSIFALHTAPAFSATSMSETDRFIHANSIEKGKMTKEYLKKKDALDKKIKDLNSSIDSGKAKGDKLDKKKEELKQCEHDLDNLTKKYHEDSKNFDKKERELQRQK